MAQKVNIILVDDLDGGVAEETVAFGLDGTQYEIDLSGKHAAALRKALDKYVEGARVLSRPRGRKPGSKNGAATRSRKRTASMEEIEASKG